MDEGIWVGAVNNDELYIKFYYDPEFGDINCKSLF